MLSATNLLGVKSYVKVVPVTIYNPACDTLHLRDLTETTNELC